MPIIFRLYFSFYINLAIVNFCLLYVLFGLESQLALTCIKTKKEPRGMIDSNAANISSIFLLFFFFNNSTTFFSFYVVSNLESQPALPNIEKKKELIL